MKPRSDDTIEWECSKIKRHALLFLLELVDLKSRPQIITIGSNHTLLQQYIPICGHTMHGLKEQRVRKANAERILYSMARANNTNERTRARTWPSLQRLHDRVGPSRGLIKLEALQRRELHLGTMLLHRRTCGLDYLDACRRQLIALGWRHDQRGLGYEEIERHYRADGLQSARQVHSREHHELPARRARRDLHGREVAVAYTQHLWSARKNTVEGLEKGDRKKARDVFRDM